MKTLKKIAAVLLIALMLGTSLVCFAAAEEKPYAYVNIYDGKKVVLSMFKVEKTDEDGDGSWTINDALLTAHKAKCKDGYASAASEWGTSITKLWNDESGAFGYYLNNKMVMTDVKEKLNETAHDVIYAYVYSDTQTWSDAYSFFDQTSFSGNAKDKVTLTLYYVTFDENYNQVNKTLEGATIYFDTKKTEYKTDANGKVEVELPTYSTVISAEKDGMTLIPPICRYNLIEKHGSPYLIIIIVATVVIAAAAVCVIIFNKKKTNKEN